MDYFIDTNIFIRVFVKENEKTFKKCCEFLQLVEKKKIKAWTSSLVLVEIDWVLESFYKFKKQRAVEALESISKLRGLKVINEANIALALDLYKRRNIKLIDALIASNPKVMRGETTIVSYDRDFEKIKVKRMTPDAFANFN